jgi:mRNA-degrading endonuclease toxin of MazEF toxin-antitoxin module
MTIGGQVRVYPWEARIDLNGVSSKALADQLRTVSKARFLGLAGMANADELAAIDDALRFQLGL